MQTYGTKVQRAVHLYDGTPPLNDEPCIVAEGSQRYLVDPRALSTGSREKGGFDTPDAEAALEASATHKSIRLGAPFSANGGDATTPVISRYGGIKPPFRALPVLSSPHCEYEL